jgi:hypothetical protein
VVGWALWAQLAFQVRRGRRTRAALDAPVEAELAMETDAEPVSTGRTETISAVER